MPCFSVRVTARDNRIRQKERRNEAMKFFQKELDLFKQVC